jgi:hypothetical protein
MSNTPTAGEPSRPRQAVVSNSDDKGRIKILVCGWRKCVHLCLAGDTSSSRTDKLRAGKTSCIKTVFQGASPKDTAYFGATQKVEKVNYE